MGAVHYLVYYPVPQYTRRAITDRLEGRNISFLLIDKLYDLKNVVYKEELKELASIYRQDERDDYKIALKTTAKLWSGKNVKDSNYKGVEVEYPEIQRNLEDILLENPEYRDHFLHQFQVFLLGVYIIDKLYGKEKCLRDFEQHNNCPIEIAWLIVSTYHDFNYSIQRYDFLIKEFFRQTLYTKSSLSTLDLGNAFIRENFFLKTKKICEELGLEMNHVVMSFFYEQVVTKRNHGLLSALSLLKLFENSNSQSLNDSALAKIAVAIAVHDGNIWEAFSGMEENGENSWYKDFSKNKYLRNLEFQKRPLAFLLIFCDTVQEWGRVGRNYKESEPRLEEIDVDSKGGTSVSISVRNDTYYDIKEKEIKRVKRFLKDSRFKFKLKSRTGEHETIIPMTGK